MLLTLCQAVADNADSATIHWKHLDLPVLDQIQKRLCEPFSPYAGVGPMRYLDSPASLPVWVDLASYATRVGKGTLADTLVSGEGLEHVVAHPGWDDAAALVAEVQSRCA